MTIRTIASAQDLVSKRERQLREARADLRAASVDALPTAHGSVIKFALQHVGTSTRVYSYAALLAEGRWYTTGSTCPARGRNAAELVAFILDSRNHSVYNTSNGTEIDI